MRCKRCNDDGGCRNGTSHSGYGHVDVAEVKNDVAEVKNDVADAVLLLFL